MLIPDFVTLTASAFLMLIPDFVTLTASAFLMLIPELFMLISAFIPDSPADF